MSRHQIIKTETNIFEVLEGNVDNALVVHTADGKNEKHVPFVVELENGYLVKIGETMDHPMTEEHYIQFIELIIDDNRIYRHYLSPTDKPESTFIVEKGTNVVAREYCNIHGLWGNK